MVCVCVFGSIPFRVERKWFIVPLFFIIYLFKCTHIFVSLFGCHTCSIFLAICFKLFFDWKTKQIIIKSTKYPHTENKKKKRHRIRLIWNVIPPSICFICFYGHSTTRRYPTHPILLYCGNTIKIIFPFLCFRGIFFLSASFFLHFSFFSIICSALPRWCCIVWFWKPLKRHLLCVKDLLRPRRIM